MPGTPTRIVITDCDHTSALAVSRSTTALVKTTKPAVPTIESGGMAR
nr:hypothetical protein BJQ95_00036 [Cryobacterium sp. SO1]